MRPERRVWIAQCLCPQRHAILASADEAETPAAAAVSVLDPLRARVSSLLQAGVLNPWCGQCNARSETWQYELGRTPFHSMEEAMPALKQSEAEQMLARFAFGDLPRSD
jgi:hypothetical protein